MLQEFINGSIQQHVNQYLKESIKGKGTASNELNAVVKTMLSAMEQLPFRKKEDLYVYLDISEQDISRMGYTLGEFVMATSDNNRLQNSKNLSSTLVKIAAVEKSNAKDIAVFTSKNDFTAMFAPGTHFKLVKVPTETGNQFTLEATPICSDSRNTSFPHFSNTNTVSSASNTLHSRMEIEEQITNFSEIFKDLINSYSKKLEQKNNYKKVLNEIKETIAEIENSLNFTFLKIKLSRLRDTYNERQKLQTLKEDKFQLQFMFMTSEHERRKLIHEISDVQKNFGKLFEAEDNILDQNNTDFFNSSHKRIEVICQLIEFLENATRVKIYPEEALTGFINELMAIKTAGNSQNAELQRQKNKLKNDINKFYKSIQEIGIQKGILVASILN